MLNVSLSPVQQNGGPARATGPSLPAAGDHQASPGYGWKSPVLTKGWRRSICTLWGGVLQPLPQMACPGTFSAEIERQGAQAHPRSPRRGDPYTQKDQILGNRTEKWGKREEDSGETDGRWIRLSFPHHRSLCPLLACQSRRWCGGP